MPSYLLLALNGPTDGPGDEDAFNRWYDEVHLPDLKAINGVVSARRFKVLNSKLPENARHPYVAVYEIQTDSIDAVLETMGTQMRPFSSTFDRSRSAHILAIEVK